MPETIGEQPEDKGEDTEPAEISEVSQGKTIPNKPPPIPEEVHIVLATHYNAQSREGMRMKEVEHGEGIEAKDSSKQPPSPSMAPMAQSPWLLSPITNVRSTSPTNSPSPPTAVRTPSPIINLRSRSPTTVQSRSHMTDKKRWSTSSIGSNSSADNLSSSFSSTDSQVHANTENRGFSMAREETQLEHINEHPVCGYGDQVHK